MLKNKEVNEVVDIKDPTLESKIKEQLKIKDEKVTKDDMLRLKKLDIRSHANHNPIESLKGIESAKNLKKLRIENQEIKDITLISELKSLKKLYLSSNEIEDITPIASLTKLSGLKITNNPIKNFFRYEDNKTNIPYFILIEALPITSDMTYLQRKKLEDYLYYNLNKKRAEDLLRSNPKFYTFARLTLTDTEIRTILADRLSNASKRYYKNFMKISPFEDESKAFAQEHGGRRIKKLLLEKELSLSGNRGIPVKRI